MKVFGVYSKHMQSHKRIVLVIKNFYKNFKCRVEKSNTSFNVKTGVRQGCCMSSLLFSLTIVWVMRQTTADQPRGIRWTLFSTLEDLDFAYDLALLSHTPAYARENIPAMHLCTASRSEGQSEEDQGDDAERLQPSGSERERRRSSNN